MLAMRTLDVNSGLLETITAKKTKRTLGPDQVCGIVCRGRIWKKMINNPSLMEDEFHDWLSQCPNNWVRVAVDKDSSTYMFYRNDD